MGSRPTGPSFSIVFRGRTDRLGKTATSRLPTDYQNGPTFSVRLLDSGCRSLEKTVSLRKNDRRREHQLNASLLYESQGRTCQKTTRVLSLLNELNSIKDSTFLSRIGHLLLRGRSRRILTFLFSSHRIRRVFCKYSWNVEEKK